MKKLITLAGALSCLIAINKPVKKQPTQIINNYILKSTGCGKCGGHCHGGK